MCVGVCVHVYLCGNMCVHVLLSVCVCVCVVVVDGMKGGEV